MHQMLHAPAAPADGPWWLGDEIGTCRRHRLSGFNGAHLAQIAD